MPPAKTGRTEGKKEQAASRETDMSYYLYEIRQKQE